MSVSAAPRFCAIVWLSIVKPSWLACLGVSGTSADERSIGCRQGDATEWKPVKPGTRDPRVIQ